MNQSIYRDHLEAQSYKQVKFSFHFKMITVVFIINNYSYQIPASWNIFWYAACKRNVFRMEILSSYVPERRYLEAHVSSLVQGVSHLNIFIYNYALCLRYREAPRCRVITTISFQVRFQRSSTRAILRQKSSTISAFLLWRATTSGTSSALLSRC